MSGRLEKLYKVGDKRMANLSRQAHPIGSYCNLSDGLYVVTRHVSSFDCFQGGLGISEMELVKQSDIVLVKWKIDQMNGTK